ncbi:MAG: phenylalanine--tRNA ligase subunit beta [Treponemataceae bacterium]|nr:phenylalanine--tRNA ligase subunit beta [Treponemataceae bacterium]
MFVSMNWIQEYVDLSGFDIESLIKRFTLSTAEVEEIYHKGEEVQGVIIAQIESVEKHPDSKKLHLLKVNTGKEVVDVVCGAPNVEVGQKVAFAPVGSHVVGMEIKEAKIAGYMSYGMCCGEDELGISDDHTGLMAIDCDAPLGSDLKSVYAIDDIIFEVDNKSLTNRPDLWGHYGIAREFSVITGRELRPLPLTEPKYSGTNKIEVDVRRPDLTWRYSCVAFKNITRKVSPTDWRIRLFYCGMRAINLLVDMTNIIMLEMGQPTHAFDGTGIKSIEIGTESKDFKFKTLDEVERNIDPDMLMIYNNGKPSAIAGIMGGLESEIEGESNSTVLECACFDGVSIRKTSQRLGHRTDASMRYEKMLDPELTIQAVYRFWNLLSSVDQGAQVDSQITDVYVKHYPTLTIDFDKNYIDRYTGIDISSERIYKTLTALGFKTEQKGDNFHVTVPSWRATKDVSLKADIVEEVSRIYGYDNFEITSTDSLLKPVKDSIQRSEDNKVKDILVKRFSMHEVHSYIWYDGKKCSDLAIEIEDNPKLLNSVTPENTVLRNSMIPTLLCMIYENKSWKDQYGIFEIGRVVEGTNQDGTCNERSHLGCVIYNKHKSEKEVYLDTVRTIRYIVDSIKHSDNITFEKIEVKHNWQHPKNTSSIIVDGKVIGTLGTLHPMNASKIDKNAGIVYFEIDMPSFNEISESNIDFKDPSKFPSIDYDISLVIPKTSSLGKGLEEVKALKIAELNDISIIDVYELPLETSVTVRFSFAAYERTLTMDEVQKHMDRIVAELNKFDIKARF